MNYYIEYVFKYTYIRGKLKLDIGSYFVVRIKIEIIIQRCGKRFLHNILKFSLFGKTGATPVIKMEIQFLQS